MQISVRLKNVLILCIYTKFIIIDFLNSFNYYQIYAMKHTHIYIRTHTTKQNKSNLTITQNTQLQLENQEEKKYQPPQNYNPRFKTHKSNIKIKIKTTNLIITHTTKSINRIKKQQKKKLHLSYTNHHKRTGAKEISSIVSSIVGVAVGSGEFK